MMQIKYVELKKLLMLKLNEALRPIPPEADFVHAKRASDKLDDAVEQLEALIEARQDLEPTVMDLISAIHRVQETLDRFKIKDKRF